VQDRGLQHAAERRRLRRLTFLTALRLLDRVAQVGVEIPPQLRQVDAARRQDALALVVVRQRVEQMLERDVGMPARDRLAVGDGQQYFNRRGKHRGPVASLFLFYRRTKRELGVARHRGHGFDLGLRHFPRIDAGQAVAVARAPAS
jgi:hypothetical protein